jgi:hypothetical protein
MAAKSGTKKYRLRRQGDRGFGGSGRERPQVSVIELPADEEPPEGAEPVPDDTELHDWRAAAGAPPVEG